MAGGMTMSEFLLLCAKVCCFMLVLISVIWNFTARYDRKNKIRKVEKELAKNSEPVKYTFSSVFPNKETEDEVFEIIKQMEEERNKEK
jgi:hypothetical protein